MPASPAHALPTGSQTEEAVHDGHDGCAVRSEENDYEVGSVDRHHLHDVAMLTGRIRGEPRPERMNFASSVAIRIRAGYHNVPRSEAELLDDLDCFGSALDAELAVDRRDVGLDGRAREMKAVGDLLKGEVRRQEVDEPELGGGELVVSPEIDSLLETLEPVRQHSGIGIVMQSVVGSLRELDGTGPISDVEADVGAVQREIRVEQRIRLGRDYELTAAELRLIHFLPTHLSLQEIADRLFLSRPTVKTHIASIYRKLHVDGRSEAVELIDQLGLGSTKSTVADPPRD